MSGNKHKSLSIKEKLKVIEFFELGKNKDEIIKYYNCSRATINRILRDKETIIEKSKTVKLTAKRERHGACKSVEAALLKWFHQMRSSGSIVSRNIMLEKSSQFAVHMGVDFSPSAGWLHRWQKRNRIELRNIAGEGASADEQSASEFMTTIYPRLVQNYIKENIFNADESGLFFKAMPKKTLNKVGHALMENKSSKERVTLLFICNSVGSYKKVIVIGKSRKPH